MTDFREQFVKHLDAMPLPPLGDDKDLRIHYAFTEADMNTIAFAVSFTQHALVSTPLDRIREHYGRALEKLAARIRDRV